MTMEQLENASHSTSQAGRNPFGLVDTLLRGQVFGLLKKLGQGSLTIAEGEKVSRFGERSAEPGLRSVVEIHDPAFYRAIALRGSVGAGEAYMDHLWTCDDLTAAIRIFARNRDLLGSLDRGWSRLTSPLLRFRHLARRNTRRGGRKNIAEHYDLGNDLFELFLDDTMMYSCAFFEKETMSLREASVAKLDRICRKLELDSSDHVLEIGTGWGGFALHAARDYGCRVTTTTISRAQFDFARERVARAGLSDRITILLRDYRDLEGQFDKLVSIEMIEAVGYEYLETYLRSCDERLRPGGRALIQAITIAEEFLEEAMRSVDFIKRYIFPGSALPAVSQLRRIVGEATRLEWIDTEEITPHYARTLRLWRERFMANLDRVRAIGYPERFIRMWDFYLAYCEAGFLERHIGDVQILLRKGSSEA